jgi:hypothetical protein
VSADELREDDKKIINTTTTEHLQDNEIKKDFGFLKNIGLNEAKEDGLRETEYKKFSVDKLRTIALNKGIINEGDRFKKREIINLLLSSSSNL